MHGVLTLGLTFADGSPEKNIPELLAALSIGSTDTISIPRTSECCPDHEDPSILALTNVAGHRDYDFEVDIALPPCLCGLGTGLAVLLSSATYCSVFSSLERFCVVDIQLPGALLKEYRGPRFGVEGMRKELGVPKRPVLGLILKPRLRPSIPDLVPFVLQALGAGVDYVIDDELVVSPPCSPFCERERALQTAVRQAADKCGRPKHYVMNATADIEISKRIVGAGISDGVRVFSLNAVTMGFSAVKAVVDGFDGAAMFVVNNIGRGVLTRKGSHCISEDVLALLSRLAGADAVYTGPLTKDYPYSTEVLKGEMLKLQGDLAGLRRCFGVSSGNILLEQVLSNVDTLGSDMMLQMGRGFFDEPTKVRKKVTALVHILDVVGDCSERGDAVGQLRRILHQTEEKNRKGLVNMNGRDDIEKKRRADLEDNITKEFELLKRIEDAERTCDRPKEQQRLQTERREVRERLLSLALEYALLTMPTHGKTPGGALPGLSELIFDRFMALAVGDPADRELEAIAHDTLNVIAALKTNMQTINLAVDVRQRLAAVPDSVSADVTISDKLKFTVPIIPMLLKYEGEIALTGKTSLSGLWRRIVLYVKQRT